MLRWPWWKWALLVAAILMLVAAFAPWLLPSHPPHAPARLVCLTRLRQLSMGLQVYATENGECWPAAGAWHAAAAQALPGQKATVWLCPAAPQLSFGYALNAGVAGRKLDECGLPDTTVLLFDSVTGKPNAADRLTSLPRPGRHPAGRVRGNSFSYADGHVAWVADGGSARPQK